MPLLRAVALGHEDARLAALPRHPWLEPVDLRDLELPSALAGNDLAESRFLLSPRADALADSADYVGMLPARWDERFPTWPRLRELSALAPWLRRDRLLAPSAHPIAHARVGAWIRRQDEVHPGMSELLATVRTAWSDDAAGESEASRETAAPLPTPRTTDSSVLAPPTPPPTPFGSGWGTAVWGSTFIVHRDEFRALLDAFRAAFTVIHAQHALDLPHEYRCPRCGRTSPWGIGRWSDDRHASYFYERVTGLHFARRSGLTLIDHQGRPRLPTRRRHLAQRLPNPRLGTASRAGRPCDRSDPRACA